MTTTCPACGKSGAQDWGVDGGHAVMCCDACGSIYYPRPIEVLHNYQGYYPYLASFDRSHTQVEVDLRRRQSESKLKQLARHGVDKGALADFGAGPGYFASVAAESGWSVTAFETSEDAIKLGREFLGVRYGDFDGSADAKFDAITCFHVAEHLDEPEAFFGKFRQRLTPNGLLMVQVPNRESAWALLWWRLRKLADPRRARRGSLYYPEHLTGFTVSGLQLCAKRAGFETVDIHQVSLGDADYDPMFWSNFLSRQGPGLPSLVLFMIQGAINQVGKLFGRGDWLSATFRAA